MGSSSWALVVLLTLVSVGVRVFAAPSDKLCQPPQIGEELQYATQCTGLSNTPRERRGGGGGQRGRAAV